MGRLEGILRSENCLSHVGSNLLFIGIPVGKSLWFLEAQWGPIGIVADQEGMSRLQDSPNLG